jgi:hypothetical protein
MKHKIKIRFSILSLLIILLVGNFSVAKELGFDSYMQDLDQSLKLDTTNVSVRNIIEKYCSSVLKNNLKYDDDLTYKANESAFVYIICTNVNKKFSDSFNEIKNYFT